MTRIIGLSVAAICTVGLIVASVQRIAAQSPEYLSSYFSSHKVPRQVTISKNAQPLAVLEVPIGITLSMHLSKGEFIGPDDKTGEVTFKGDVSIRTRPHSELIAGVRLSDQMMSAPLKLDVQDAAVTVVPKK